MPSIFSNRRQAARKRYRPTHLLRGLPARFRRERILIVGCGDVGTRLLKAHFGAAAAWRVLTSSPQRIAFFRSLGVVPLVADLDRPDSLTRLGAIATRVIHLAPPQRVGTRDLRTRALLQQLAAGGAEVRSALYVSTSGVYGDCNGDWVAETRAVAPATARGVRRVDAEARMRTFGHRGTRVTILRAPGIYALDRAGDSLRERLLRKHPTLLEEDDVYTNHIHADDLMRACWLALWRGPSMRVFNANDDTVLKMGDYFDRAAQILALPKPPRISRCQALETLGEMRMSFLSESRRLVNERIKKELRLAWRYPTVDDGLATPLDPGHIPQSKTAAPGGAKMP